MKLLAWLVALFIVLVGLVGLVVPDRLVSAAGSVRVTPLALYLAAAGRMSMGLVLILVAPASRAPRTLRIFGVVALVAGLTTPLIGVNRANAVLHWWSQQGPTVIRLFAVVPIALGAFVASMVAAGRRAA